MLVVETAVGRAVLSAARALGLSVDALADRLGLSATALTAVLRGEAEVDGSLASRLSEVLGQTPAYWLELDSDEDEVALVAAWVDALDDFQQSTLQALRARGEVTATRAQRQRLAAELAAFFGCFPDEVDAQVDASFRQSAAHVVHADAVSTWLRLADRQATWLADLWDVPALDTDGLRALLPDLVRVGRQEPADYLPSVQEQLAEVGVVLVFQADVKGSRLSGASWPAPGGQGMVALTLRHRYDDFFWWTVFHECAHLLLGHGRVLDSLDAHAGEKETQADGLALELLHLPVAWDNAMARPSKQRVSELGTRLGVPVGLLVGQLQHTHRVKPKDMNGLKRSMPDPEELEVHGRRRPSGAGWDKVMDELVSRATRAS